MRETGLSRSRVISIHAPPRGATGIAELACRRMAISIHAPPRGATISGSALHQDNLIFQFTPLREGRLKAFLDGDEVRLFQFTPLREGRLARRAAQSAAAHFNSRPSARGDPLLISGRIPREIFQFTPLREGRRQGISGWRLGSPISIHAPPRGATGKRVYFSASSSISIHAPPRGATRRKSNEQSLQHHFNSRPSARGDCASRCSICRCAFQFTPLREGRPKYQLAILLYNVY